MNIHKFILRVRRAWRWSKVDITHWSLVGNRIISRGMIDQFELTVTSRDTTKPDAYSREELLQMLEIVRHNEDIQGWKCPEPYKCTYCGHSCPTNESGFCPGAKETNKEGGVKSLCECPLHNAGLYKARREQEKQDLREGRWTTSQTPLAQTKV